MQANRLAPLLVLAALVAASPLTQAQQPAAPQGRWITESGNLEVEITPCGAALCGKVVRVLANRSMSGPGAEMTPADARPALGMEILSGLQPAGDGEFQGRIYNRENGKTYSATLRAEAPDQLLVRGYIGLPLFGKTQVWRRPTAPEAAR
ncbi:DUF2147 domain-containing protein [Caenimonas sedimenti]|uniref:DUF2147 domain-containing protein n=1 Tax=Caenimonas sedimenti TaxID=2596921 RepID=A0A562ZGL8_9BURK|nr:DUF2147 domain-containing protein [Caenimonas sedimenti]TWO67722.1 DUF2147 domain-containing protein [Caenimonas sedimenti]